jgi:tetratricopeptide (TPR) repeat protein
MVASPATGSAGWRRETLLAVLLLVGATGAAYANTFAVPFLFDDFLSIQDNVTIRHWLTAFSPPAGDGITVSGRPLLNFTFALNYAVSGDSVWSYHAGNLLIHALAACVLFGLGRHTLQGPRLAARFGADATALALVIALLWALHPLQTESVTYLVQRAESLAGLMYLLTLWLFARAVEQGAGNRGQGAWLAATWLGCLLGMAAKETMVTAPVMVLLYDRVFAAESWREVWTKRGRFHLALAATWLLLAALVVTTGGRGGSVGFAGDMSAGGYALTQIGAVAHYLRLAFWPHPLVLDYGTALAGGWRDVWWQALVLLPLAVASFWAAWRNRPVGYVGVFFFAALAPSSSFVPVITQTVSEHRVYLALAAVITVVVLALHAAVGRRALLIGGGLLALGLGVGTFARNQTYRSEIGIWEDTVAKRPGNARAWTILGTLYERADRLPEARASLEHAVQVDPRNAEAWSNLGNVWLKLREWDQAIDCYRQALVLKPAHAQILSNLGMTLKEAGRIPEAVVQLEAALRADPKLDNIRLYLAALLVQAGNPARAAEHFAIYLRARPDDAGAHANYGSLLLLLGRGQEGLAEFARAVELRPNDAELHNNLGLALAKAGRVAEALPHFREAVRLKPDFAQARRNAEHAARSLERR